MLGKLTLYVMRFCSLSLKESTDISLEDEGKIEGKKFVFSWCVCPPVISRQTCLVLWRPIKKLTATVMTVLSGSFQQLHQRHKTHRQKRPGVEYHGVAIFFFILSNMTSLLYSEHLLFFLWNKNNKKSLKDCNAAFSYTIAVSVMEDIWFILKLFHKRSSKNPSNQFSTTREEKWSKIRKISGWARGQILHREEGTQGTKTLSIYHVTTRHCPLTPVLGGAISPTG